MTVELAIRPAETIRYKRKAHKKSRLGCRNCKLRRIKCDETRPSCNKCVDFGVLCNRDQSVGDLQPLGAQGSAIGFITSQKEFKTADPTANRMMIRMISENLEQGRVKDPSQRSYANCKVVGFGQGDFERLQRFQCRVIETTGPLVATRVWQKLTIGMASAHPFLMHLVQTLTLVHDRYIQPDVGRNPRLIMLERYHSVEAAAIMQQKLSNPLRDEDRDALWGAAFLLGIIAAGSIEVTDPEDAWPFRPSSPSDLEWIRMSSGKKAIYDLVQPFREGSVYSGLQTMFNQHAPQYETKNRTMFNFVYPSMVKLCDLDDEDLDIENSNPYHSAIHNLAPLLDNEISDATLVPYLSYVGFMEEAFTQLLDVKDPRAMLILAYWFSKVCHGRWWIARRASIEGRAICIYLTRFYSNWTEIQHLLWFPKSNLGMLD
ncbi:hypothetical protein MMC25_001560 [Agyrium rufum]|nr:hypothetical protein [Agyrium rufum]